MRDDQRSFTVIHLLSNKKLKKKKGGRYISTTPRRAAIKAFNRECRNSKIKGVCAFVTIIQETTQGGSSKVYRYKMNRRLLSKPIQLKTHTIKYKTFAKRIKPISFKKFQKRTQSGGGSMDFEMEDEDDGIFTGFYNIYVGDKILHVGWFALDNEEPDQMLVKRLMKQHKKDFKSEGITSGISMEIYDILFYPRSEGMKAVRDSLNYQLPIMQDVMKRLNDKDIRKRINQNAFSLDDLMRSMGNLQI